MIWADFRKYFIGLFSCFCISCQATNDGIATLAVSESSITEDSLKALAGRYYQDHQDEYDMLVLFGDEHMSPAYSFYLPVKNDVSGVGYEHSGTEIFDNARDFSSRRLQGIVWIGPAWRDKLEQHGREGVLEVLAHETAHRWAAQVTYDAAGPTKQPSQNLLGSPYHWNYFLDTGGSLLGGNRWQAMGENLFYADKVGRALYSHLDLYLMGLIESSEVPPVKLLVDVKSVDGGYLPAAESPRVSTGVTVSARIEEILVEQIISAEGPRKMANGFSARAVCQAWLYIHPSQQSPDMRDLKDLNNIHKGWPTYFSEIVGGRGSVCQDSEVEN